MGVSRRQQASGRSNGTTGRLAGLSLVVVVALGILLAGAAAAQDDPYGSTSTTAGSGPPGAATCELTVTSGEPGVEGTATVHNVPFGGTVRILLGGIEVGRATAPQSAQSVGAPVLLGGQVLPQQAARTTVTVPFVVPSMPPGPYLMTAVGVDFAGVCSAETGGHVDVLGETVTRDGGGRSLPRTGIYVLLLLAIAVALVLTGRALIEESRRRRRRAEWDERAEAARSAMTDEQPTPSTK